MTTVSSALGASVKRREDPRLITGQGTFVDDIKLVGMLHMALVRSPHAHAKINSIDTSGAKEKSGVVAVYTGEDLKEALGSLICGWVVPDTKEVPHPPLAIDKVRCVGDAVAAVIATDAAIAVDAADRDTALSSALRSLAVAAEAADAPKPAFNKKESPTVPAEATARLSALFSRLLSPKRAVELLETPMVCMAVSPKLAVAAAVRDNPAVNRLLSPNTAFESRLKTEAL